MIISRDEFKNKVRDYIKDHPVLNKLIEQEFTDSDIDFAIDLAIDDFNNTPPYSLTINSFNEFPSLSLLLDGTLIFLLRGRQLWYSRNRLPYMDGDISVDPYNKAGEYAAIINQIAQNYVNTKMMLKKTKNLEEFYGEYIPRRVI
jgi:hypothetical protein